MTAQTIAISYDATNGFKFNGNANGDVTVSTSGSNTLTFSRASGQTWTFKEFSVGLGVQANADTADETVKVGVVNNVGSSFSWTVADASVTMINQDRVRQGETHEYEYSFVINVPGVGSVPCDPKIYNRIS